MTWQLWQIVLLSVGDFIFVLFEVLAIVNNVKASKAKKKQSEELKHERERDPDNDN